MRQALYVPHCMRGEGTHRPTDPRDQVEDILITLNTRYHLVRVFHQNDNIFTCLVLGVEKSNPAPACIQLEEIDKALGLWVDASSMCPPSPQIRSAQAAIAGRMVRVKAVATYTTQEASRGRESSRPFSTEEAPNGSNLVGARQSAQASTSRAPLLWYACDLVRV